jgi:NADH:ubiquinone oxidoreductase subunit H
MFVGYNIISIIEWVVFLLVTVAFFTLGERKLMAAIQRRKGPDVVGFWGLLQPAADGAKLIFKELIFPLRASLFLFLFGPIFVFSLSLMGWAVIPLSDFSFISTIHIALLYVLITGGLNIYGLIMAGWSSNSRYAFLGGVRATAQMISYELILGTINLFVAFYAGSFNYVDIVLAQKSVWFVVPLFPVFLLYLIVMLAETNRTPFDLAEAEAELVAGYNVEYSSIMFAMFFLGEYSNMILLSVICVLLFFGGWSGLSVFSTLFFLVKILFFCVFFIWVRATLPRYRYDQLMEFGWKHLLPFSFGLFIFCVSFCLLFGVRVDALDGIFYQNIIYSIYFQEPRPVSCISDLSLSFLLIEVDLIINQYYV